MKELLEAADYSQGESIDKIVVIKKERTMYLYRDGEVVNTLPVSLGKNPVGHKQQQGDNRTPEGEFFIHRKLCSPKYYRSLCISYPRAEDKASAARKRGQSRWSSNASWTTQMECRWRRGQLYPFTKLDTRVRGRYEFLR